MSDPGDRFTDDRVLPNCGLPYDHERHPFEPCPNTIGICDGKSSVKAD